MTNKFKIPPESHLRLWFEFMVLSDRHKWSRYLKKFFGPRPAESFEVWLARVHEDLELYDPPLIEVHRSVGDFEAYFAPEYPDLHMSANLLAPKAAIKREFNRLLDLHHKSASAPYKTGATQLNGPVDVSSLQKILTVLRAEVRTPKPKDLALAAEVGHALPEQPTPEQANVAYAVVSRYRRKGREILEGVTQGRFPEPRRAANDPAAPLDVAPRISSG